MASTLQTPDDCCDDCGPCDVSVTLANPAFGVFVVDTIPELRELPTLSTNAACQVNGNLARGDGGGGMYFWVNDGTDADDGVTYIRPNDYVDGGIWQKLI